MAIAHPTAAGTSPRKMLATKVALVTGAGSGIGAACATALGLDGASVVIADMNMDGAEQVASAIRAADGKARAVQVDVTDPASVEAMLGFVRDTYGGLDIAVNNAGIGGGHWPTAAYPLDTWQRVIAVNLNGVFYCLQYELQAMFERGGGSIVNLASVLGTVGQANSSAYVASKHGVVGLTKCVALEYATRGIRVNTVCPGYIDTPLLQRVSAAERGELIDRHPIGRLGTSDEVGALVRFLASDQASFMTGGCYVVDGGYTAQ